MRKTKPTRKIAVSWRGHHATIHWATLKKVEAKPSDRVFTRVMHGLSDFHPACTEKYAHNYREVPKGKPLKVTCKKCIALWGEQ